MAEKTKQSDSGVTWGGIVAGAAVAAGAVLVFPTLIPSIVENAGDLVDGIGDMISKATTSLSSGAASTSLSSLVSEINPEKAQQLAGVAIAGGGLAYLGMSGKKSPDDMFDAAVAEQDAESFAGREEMKRMQAIMMARMQAASPQYMAQMAPAPQR